MPSSKADLEKNLKKSLDRYRQLYENANDIIFLLDSRGRFIDYNRRAYESLGYRKNALLGKNFDTIVLSESIGIARKNFILGMQGRSVPPYTVKIRSGKGEVEIIEIRSSSLLENGKIIGRFGVARNITRRVQAEEALDKTKRQQEAILSNIPDIAWLKDNDSRYVAVNEPFGKACGVKPNDLVGKDDFDIWPRKLALHYRRDDKEVMVTGKRKLLEEPLVSASGEVSWLETVKTPIYGDNGEVIGTTGISRDITDRKRMEEAIKLSEEKYRQHFENVRDVIFSMDRNYRLTSVSPSAYEAIGFLPEEAIGKRFWEVPLLSMDDVKRAKSIVKSLFGGRKPRESEYAVTTKDGSRKIFALTTTHLRKNGRIIGALSVARDVTEKKRLEDEKLELSRLATIGTFSASIAHEIRNPLFAISMIASLLENECRRPRNTKLFGAMTSEIERLKRFVDEMLFYSKPRRIAKKPIDVSAMIKDIFYANRAIFKAKRLKMKLTARGKERPMFHGDSDQLRRLFLNLLLNAHESSNRGGTIDVSIKTQSGKGGQHLSVSIHNKGRHIRKSDMPRIFDFFFSTKPKGCGLGLPISRKIAEAHDGHIGVTSSKRAGTTFTVQL